MRTSIGKSVACVSLIGTIAACGSVEDVAEYLPPESSPRASVDGQQAGQAFGLLAPVEPAPAPDAGLGLVSIGDARYPILAAEEALETQYCGPGMLEPQLWFEVDGVEHTLHLDLVPTWDLPDEPTDTAVPGELMDYGWAQLCVGLCYDAETYQWAEQSDWLNAPLGNLRVHVDGARVVLEDVELSFPDAQSAEPVKLTLTRVELTNLMGW